jgi:hypothetical protein
MKQTQDQLKAELLAEAKKVIDELLDWHEGSEAPTLTETEDAVLKLRRRLGERMAGVVIGDQEALRPVPGPSCPTCGKEMHYGDMKTASVKGRMGMTELERAYYDCDRCRSSLFLPGSTTEAGGVAKYLTRN